MTTYQINQHDKTQRYMQLQLVTTKKEHKVQILALKRISNANS